MLRYFEKEKITVFLIRGGSGAYVNGEWTPTFDVPVPIRIIAPQPLTANDAQLLPDGEHVRDYLRSWSSVKVYPRERDEDADRIAWRGNIYKVMQCDDRRILGKFYAFEMRKATPGSELDYVFDSDTAQLVIDSDTGEAVVNG